MPWKLIAKVTEFPAIAPYENYTVANVTAAKIVWTSTLNELSTVVCPTCDGYGHIQRNCPTYNSLSHAHNGNHCARRVIKRCLQQVAQDRPIVNRPAHGYVTLCGKRSLG